MAALSDKEEQKLDLEIESLQKENKWGIRAQFMPPIIATSLGVIGLLATFCQFQSQRRTEQDRTISEQQKDRSVTEADQRTRAQNQIRGDIDEILESTRNEKKTISRVAFLLDDMKTVLASSLVQTQPNSNVSEAKTVEDIYPGYKRKLTESLIIMIKDDCDFTRRPRDVGLANTVFTHWSDYSDYFRDNPEQLEWILYQYIRALQTLRDENPGYLEGMMVEDEGYKPPRRYERRKDEPILYGRLIDLLEGFENHLDILGKGNVTEATKKVKRNALEEFEAALCNPALSKFILEADFTNQSCRR